MNTFLGLHCFEGRKEQDPHKAAGGEDHGGHNF